MSGVKSGDIADGPTLSDEYKIISGYIVGPKVDLSGADLSDVNLTGMDLSEVNLSNADLSGANLLNAKVEANNWEYLDSQQKEEAFHTIKVYTNSETITGTSFKVFIEDKMFSNFINAIEF